MTHLTRTEAPRPRIGSSGFTLIEMSVVLVVLGLIAATGVYGTRRFVQSSRLAGATNTLLADLHYARSLAVSERRSIQVTFSSGGYSVVRVSPAEAVFSRPCPQGVTCSATGTTTFFPYGLAVPTTVTLQGGGTSKIVRLAVSGNLSRD